MIPPCLLSSPRRLEISHLRLSSSTSHVEGSRAACKLTRWCRAALAQSCFFPHDAADSALQLGTILLQRTPPMSVTSCRTDQPETYPIPPIDNKCMMVSNLPSHVCNTDPCICLTPMQSHPTPHIPPPGLSFPTHTPPLPSGCSEDPAGRMQVRSSDLEAELDGVRDEANRHIGQLDSANQEQAALLQQHESELHSRRKQVADLEGKLHSRSGALADHSERAKQLQQVCKSSQGGDCLGSAWQVCWQQLCCDVLSLHICAFVSIPLTAS